MEKLKKKRGGIRTRFSLVANALRRMLGENNKQNITLMFLERLKKNLDDLQRLDRAIQELLAVEDVTADRMNSETYRSVYEQLCAQYRKCPKKRYFKSASEKFQVLSELRSTPERTLPPNVFRQPAGDISECSPDREPTLPSSENIFSPANQAKSWDQLVNQIEALEDSLSPELVGDRAPDTPVTRDTHRHTIRSYLRTISLTRLLVALVDDVSPERLPARDWRRVQRALAAPPLGADRVYVIKNNFLLQRSLQALWATLHVVSRNDVERCSAARAGEGAAQRMERWRAAYRDYCMEGARGSLLLLQRRWHEMRLLARAWARTGEDGVGETARLLRELCRTFPHVVQEEPQRWQELRRAGELDLDPYDSGNSEYSDEEEGNLVIDEGPTEARTGVGAGVGLDQDPYDSDNSEYSDEEQGNLVIDEGPTEARTGVDARVGVGGASLLDEGDDVIDKLHQIDPAQIKTTLIFDSDTEMDVESSPGSAAVGDRVAGLQGKNCSHPLSPTTRTRDRLVFEEDDEVGGSSACVGGGVTNIEVKSEPGARIGEGGAGSEGAVVAAPARGTLDSKLTMEARVLLVRVDELPTWRERARGETPHLGGPRGGRSARGVATIASSSRDEGSPRGKYAGKCEQLLSVCRPVSVLLERLPLHATEGAEGECGVGCRCVGADAGVAGGTRCGRVVLPHLAQVLAQRRCLLTAQVAPLVRDHGTTPAPGRESAEHAGDRPSESWHALDLDAEKSYEPEEILVRTRSPAVGGPQWVRLRGVELLRRLYSQLLACVQRHRLLTGEGATRGGEPGAGPPTPGENFEDRVKKNDSKKKKIPPTTRGQDPTDPPGRRKRTKKEKVKPAPEAKDPPKDGISEYERWLEERNRGSLMYGFKPREVKTWQFRELTEPACKKTLLKSHETVAADTDKAVEGGGGGKTVEGGGGGKTVEGGGGGKTVEGGGGGKTVEGGGGGKTVEGGGGGKTVEGGGGGKTVEGGGGGNKRGFLRVVPLASLQGPSRAAGGREEAHNEAVVDLCDDSEEELTATAPSLEGSLIPCSRLVVQPIVSHYNVFLESIAPNDQSSVAQIQIGQILVPQNPEPQSSIPQNPVPHSSIPINPASKSSIPQNPVPQSSIPQNPVPQNPAPHSSIPQNPVSKSSLPQNPVPQSSIPQNPVPQSSVSQNPAPQSSVLQNPAPQSSIPPNPVPQSSIPQNFVSQSFIPQNPVPQSSLPKNPAPQSSLPQNFVPQSVIPQNPVLPSTVPQNPVLPITMPQNPVLPSTMPQNPVLPSTMPQNPVLPSTMPHNPVLPSTMPQNLVPPSTMPQNPVPPSTMPQNPGPSSRIPPNPVPRSRIPQNRKVVKIVLPKGVLRVLAPRPPTSQGHRVQAPPPQTSAAISREQRVQAPINPARVYSSLVPHVAHSSPEQNAINHTYTSQGHLPHIRAFQAPVAQHRKVDGPPQYRYCRPLQETRLSTPTTLVTGNSTPFGSEPLVVGTAPPSAQPPWARNGEPTPATPQPTWTQSGEPTLATPQPTWAQSGEPTPATPQPTWTQSGEPTSATPQPTWAQSGEPTLATPQPTWAQSGEPTPATPQPTWAQSGEPTPATPQPTWAQSGEPTSATPPPWLRCRVAEPVNVQGGRLEVGVLPLTERNLALHNRIFSKSSNNRLK